MRRLNWTKKVDDDGTLYWVSDIGGYLIWVAASHVFVAEGLEGGTTRGFRNLKTAADACNADMLTHRVVH